MRVSAESHLGSYDIVSAIGAGGMGEVYRARDIRLNREVALKVLPEAFTRDPDRLARFKREAQVLASPTSSARRCSRRSGPRSGCSSTIAASGAASRRMLGNDRRRMELAFSLLFFIGRGRR